jgi:hypothetical protein
VANAIRPNSAESVPSGMEKNTHPRAKLFMAAGPGRSASKLRRDFSLLGKIISKCKATFQMLNDDYHANTEN